MKASINFRSWFFPALAFCVSLTLVATYLVAGQYYINIVRSQNIARATSLKADISTLPSIDTITPAQTSGQLDYVLSSRQALLDKTNEQLAPRSAAWVFRLHPSYSQVELPVRLQALATSATAQQLEETIDLLQNLKKLIEYSPTADLPEDFSKDPGIEERLRRTYEGLAQSASYIKVSPLEYRNQLASALSELNARTRTLDEASKVSWIRELQRVQADVAVGIKALDIQSSEYAEGLSSVLEAYQ